MSRVPAMVCVPHRIPGCLACSARVTPRANQPEEVQFAEVCAVAAEHALQHAIAAYEKAGLGPYITQPLRDALLQVQWSLSEVRS